MKKITRFIIAILLCGAYQNKACTIVSAAMGGEVFAVANEDDYAPFMKVWFNPPTKDRYGSVGFGQSDLQAQAAMNEYGLFFDFTAQNFDPALYELKNPYYGDLFFEIIGKCKNVKEALEYLKTRDYAYAAQALLADAEGNSVLINIGTKEVKKGDYQINCNCNLIAGQVSCRRADIAEEMLAKTKEISVPFFKTLLDKTHQEGDLSTQYSNIYDLKRGIIYMYFFHNFNDVYVIDLQKELQKGYRLENIADHFPTSFAYENFAQNHPLYPKEVILNEMHQKGLNNTVNYYLSLLNAPENKDSTLSNTLIEVALQLIKAAWNEHNNGSIWEYWFSMPGGYTVRYFKDKRLDAAANLLQALMKQPTFDVKYQNFCREMYAYIHLVQGNTAVAKALYEQLTVNPAATFEVSYTRSKEMLRRI